MIQGRTISAWYGTAQGRAAADLVQVRLSAMWPEVAGLHVLGFGYAPPYLEPWRAAGARCASASASGVVEAWPTAAAGLSCRVEDVSLPFPDLCFDRVLLVHGLEATGHAKRLLREMWRVLRDDGRLLVVVPNRVGLWAHVENTPFGQGQPYSPRQVEVLLQSSMFRVERRDAALFGPPVKAPIVLRSARFWEGVGRQVAPGLAGVTIAEAVKDAYAGLPRLVPSRRMVLVEQA